MTDQQAPFSKIASITPKHRKFTLLFELIEITSRKGDHLFCRIVDDTGICDACFSHFSDKLQAGVVYSMTDLKCRVVDSHIQIQMSSTTSVTKQPNRLGYRDKSNDISKKVYATKDEMEEIKKMESQGPQPFERLIPMTREEAEYQLKLKKQFDEKMKKQEDLHKKDFQKKLKGKAEKKDQNKGKFNVTVGNVGQDSKRQMKNKNSGSLEKKGEKQKYKQKGTEAEEKNLNSSKKLKYEEKQKFEKFDIRNQKSEKKQYKEKETKKENNNEKIPTPNKSEKKNKSKSVLQYKQKEENSLKVLKQSPNKGSEGKEEYIRPKFIEKKENNGEYMELISTIAHVEGHVNVKAWISANKRNQTDEGFQRMIADKTGSLWLRTTSLHLEGNEWYEIDNLFVVREEGRLILKQTEFSQARQLSEADNFDLKPISGK